MVGFIGYFHCFFCNLQRFKGIDHYREFMGFNLAYTSLYSTRVRPSRGCTQTARAGVRPTWRPSDSGSVSRGWKASPSQTGFMADFDTPRIATSGAFFGTSIQFTGAAGNPPLNCVHVFPSSRE